MTVREALGTFVIVGVLTVIVMIGSCRRAHGQELTLPDTLFIATVPVYGYEAWKDARTTRQCVEAGRCVEVNPVWASIARKDGIRRSMQWKLAAQAGLAGGLGYAMHKWPKQKWPIVSAFVTMTVLQGVVNAHNRRTLNTARAIQ